ncbi:ATP-binding protein [Streptomyces sp. NPDC048057]|uniref:ATP-binding protein n=1 Tax=Streptomyces sp. NPDC048057 TaxID=3155628 RepID=UPI003407EB30
MSSFVWRSYSFLASREAPRFARKSLRNALDAWECDVDVAETAELLASEVVTNVILHAKTTRRVQIDFGVAEDEFTFAVVDSNPMPPQARQGCDERSTSGRGLPLLMGMSSDFGYRSAGGGKVVFFRLKVQPIPVHVFQRELCSAFPPSPHVRLASLRGGPDAD